MVTIPQPTMIECTSGPLEFVDHGEGEVILSLHEAMGGYDQSYILAQTIGPEKSRYLCLSRPGYLGTPLSSGTSAEEQATLFVELLDHLEIKKSLVMAISGGGYSALTFARLYPERCSGLILASTTGGPLTGSIPLSFRIMTALAGWQWLIRRMQKKTMANVPGNLKRSIHHPDILEKTLQNSEVMNLFSTLTNSTFERMAERIPGTKNDILITGKTEFHPQQITVPTLVIHGTDDSIVPFKEHGLRLAREIPDARSYFVEKGEHVTIFTHRSEVQQQVVNFLESLPSPT